MTPERLAHIKTCITHPASAATDPALSLEIIEALESVVGVVPPFDEQARLNAIAAGLTPGPDGRLPFELKRRRNARMVDGGLMVDASDLSAAKLTDPAPERTASLSPEFDSADPALVDRARVGDVMAPVVVDDRTDVTPADRRKPRK